MTTVWITGARGFIGRHLALHLSQRGYAVAGVGHGLWPARDARDWGVATWINGDVDASTLEALRVATGDPACIFHIAGGSSVGASIENPAEDFTRTVVTSARLLDWMRLRAPEARVVAVSSAAVYGSGHDGPIPETAFPRPFSPYGHHKLMMEQLCRSYAEAYGTRSVLVRLFSVYGPWLRKQLLWDLCSRIESGASSLQLGGTGRELRDWVEISDVVRLLDLASTVDTDETMILNGGTGIGTSVSDVAHAVTRAWGSTVPITFSGTVRRGDPFSLVASPELLAERRFGWESRLDDGIERYVRWFREHRG